MNADQLQCMFLEGKLNCFKEEYTNLITRKLRTGDLRICELIQEDSDLKVKVIKSFGLYIVSKISLTRKIFP